MTEERSYTIFGQSWWAEANRRFQPKHFVDEVRVRVGEAEIPFRWYDHEQLHPGAGVPMRVEVFDGSLFGLAELVRIGLVEWLANEVPRHERDHHVTVEEFTGKLDELGFRDTTEREGGEKMDKVRPPEATLLDVLADALPHLPVRDGQRFWLVPQATLVVAARYYGEGDLRNAHVPEGLIRDSR